jgi:hypothetical protein
MNGATAQKAAEAQRWAYVEGRHEIERLHFDPLSMGAD